MTRTAALLAALLATSAAGCAPSAAALRARRLATALDAAPIERPLDETWAEVRRLLVERGFPLAGADADAVGQERYGFLLDVISAGRETTPTPGGGRRLETSWGRRSRYVAEAAPDGAAWRVRFTEVREDLARPARDGERRRDPGLELELVRRLAPTQAAAVLERAEEER